jgi:hypothetical protein
MKTNNHGSKACWDTPGWSTHEDAEAAVTLLREQLTLPPGREAYLDPANHSRVRVGDFEVSVGGGVHLVYKAGRPVSMTTDYHVVLTLTNRWGNYPLEVSGMFAAIGPDGRSHRVLVQRT